MDVSAAEDRWELWVSGVSFQPPREHHFAGIELESVQHDGEQWKATVKLGPEFSTVCAAKRATLQVDDAFGRGRRVVGIHADGLLVASKPELLLVPVQGSDARPVFDLVYRSTILIVTPSAKALNGRARSPSLYGMDKRRRRR